MNNSDIAPKVMKRIVHYEQRRVVWWLTWFLTAILFLAVGAALIGWVVAREVIERQTLELLSLFGEDWEVVSKFWRETIGVFWQEMPQRVILILALVIVGAVVLWVSTRHNRKIISKKRQSLAKYQKQSVR